MALAKMPGPSAFRVKREAPHSIRIRRKVDGNYLLMPRDIGVTHLPPNTLRIVQVPQRGPVSEACTTNTMQAALGSGTFVNGNRKDNGISIERGNFTVTNSDFNVIGEANHWEALGD